jgi:nucleoside-diphosphate-sugar epimerase
LDVIVFGGGGLIGSYTTVDLCEQGMDVAVFSRSPPKGILRSYEDRIHWINGDVGDAEQVARAVAETGARRIVHLAGALQFDCDRTPEVAMHINVGGAINVLDAARTCGVERVVFASSGAVYGVRADRMREDMPVGPEITIYGSSKLLAEQIGIRYAEQHGFGFIALRYNMTFGPGNVTSPGMAKAIQDITGAMDGAAVTMTEVGGDLLRHLTYVRDSAAAAVLALTHPNPSHHVYNVAGPDENYVSLQKLTEIMRQVAPECGPVTFTGRGREAGAVDTTRIRQDLGFEPQYSVADGLRAQREDRLKWW